MSVQKKVQSEDNAVSPVVGVMLMLVVTIVIAAVVAVFATGVVSNVSSTPTAILTYDSSDVYSNAAGTSYLVNKVSFAHKGGDDLNIGHLNVIMELYGDVKTIDSSYLSCSNGTKIVSTGDVLTVDAASSGIFVGYDPLKIGETINYKIIDIDSGNVISSGKFTSTGESVAVPSYSLTAYKTSIPYGSTVDVTFRVPSTYDRAKAKLSASDGFVLNGETPVEDVTISDGKATFSITVTGKIGECELTAEVVGSSTVKASCTVTVKPSMIASVTEITSGGSVGVTFTVPPSYNGEKATLTASGGFSLGVSDGSNPTSKTDNEIVLDIENGKAVFSGITVTSDDGKAGTCTLTVTATKDESQDVEESCTIKVKVTAAPSAD